MNHNFLDPASYEFSAYALPVAITGMLSLGLGIATLFRERRSGPSIAFLVMQATVAYWLLAYAVVYSTNNFETARVWLHIMVFGLVWIPVAVLGFALAMSEKWRRFWYVIPLTAGISVAFAVTGLTNSSFYTSELREFYWGYYPIAAAGTTVYALYQTVCLLGAAAILWTTQRETQSSIRRKRIRALLLALMISYLSGIDFLPTSGVEIYPFGFVFIGMFMVLATDAIWRYRLVDLTPEMAAPQIIDTMAEALLVVDADGIVRVANEAATEMFQVGPQKLVGMTLEEVTRARVENINDVQDNGDVNQLEFSYQDGDEERTVVVSSRPLMGNTGDLLGTIHIGHDITERKRAEEDVARSEALYRTLFETSPDSVILTDRTGTIIMANQGAAVLLRAGCPENLIGKSAVEFVTEDGRERMRETLGAVSQSSVLRSGEYSLRVTDGHCVPVELSLSRIRDKEGEVDGFLAIARDISERKRAERTIHHLAYHDPLTGLANRSLLLQTLSEAMTQADEEGSRVAILYLDLDGMKAINDTFGHTTGDDVLRQAGQRLSNIVRGEDSLARIGGDEFVIIIPGVERTDQVTAIANRVLNAIRQPFPLSTSECRLSISIGIAVYPTTASAIETLLSAADAAMYEAKSRGGNFYVYAEADSDLARAV